MCLCVARYVSVCSALCVSVYHTMCQCIPHYVSVYTALCVCAGITPVAGSNLLEDKVSRFSELSQNSNSEELFFEVNLVILWNGQNSFQQINPSNSRHFTILQLRGLFLVLLLISFSKRAVQIFRGFMNPLHSTRNEQSRTDVVGCGRVMWDVRCEKWDVSVDVWRVMWDVRHVRHERHETWEMRRETWGVRSEMWDVRCEMWDVRHVRHERDERKETWEMRLETWEVKCEMWDMRDMRQEKWELRHEKWDMRNETWDMSH